LSIISNKWIFIFFKTSHFSLIFLHLLPSHMMIFFPKIWVFFTPPIQILKTLLWKVKFEIQRFLLYLKSSLSTPLFIIIILSESIGSLLICIFYWIMSQIRFRIHPQRKIH
jgi:hypothetical protein